jgi:hypothetical protein
MHANIGHDGARPRIIVYAYAYCTGQTSRG